MFVCSWDGLIFLRVATCRGQELFWLVLTFQGVVACSILARFGEAMAAVIITAFASGATTWAEFVDAGSKVERYTRTVRTINDLLNWWRNLSEVEKVQLCGGFTGKKVRSSWGLLEDAFPLKLGDF